MRPLLLVLLAGCSTTPEPAVAQVAVPGENLLKDNSDKTPVRASLPFSIDGVGSFEGSILLQRRAGIGYKVTLQIPKGTQRVELKTCHRRWIFWSPAVPFVTVYTPAFDTREMRSACELEFTAVTKAGNKQRAIIDFSADETLPATAKCDGQSLDSKLGATFCHAATGTVQKITFGSVVRAYAEDGCGTPRPVKDAKNRLEGSVFEWKQSAGYCSYLFATPDGKEHRLDTYGWSEVERYE